MNELNATINLNDYLSQEEMHEIAVDMFHNLCSSKLGTEDEMQRILSNQAYEIIGRLIDEKYHRDMEEYLTEKCDKLLSDENTIKYELFRDDTQYGRMFGKKGPATIVLEELVKTKLRDKLEKTAEKVIAEINLDSKKFTKMVAQETAKIVAEKAFKTA